MEKFGAAALIFIGCMIYRYINAMGVTILLSRLLVKGSKF